MSNQPQTRVTTTCTNGLAVVGLSMVRTQLLSMRPSLWVSMVGQSWSMCVAAVLATLTVSSAMAQSSAPGDSLPGGSTPRDSSPSGFSPRGSSENGPPGLKISDRVTIPNERVADKGVANKRAADETVAVETELRRLSSPTHRVRKEAMRRLWNQWSQYREAIVRATEHRDPEVAARARWVMKQRRLGIGPDTSPQLARLLAGEDQTGDPLRRLLELGEYDALLARMKEAEAEAGEYADRFRVASLIQQFYPLYRIASQQRGNHDGLIRLIAQVADDASLSLTLLEERLAAGQPWNEQELLPPRSKSWDPIKRRQIETSLHAAMGDFDRAAELAADDPDLLRRLWWVRGDFRALTESGAKYLREATQDDSRSSEPEPPAEDPEPPAEDLEPRQAAPDPLDANDADPERAKRSDMSVAVERWAEARIACDRMEDVAVATSLAATLDQWPASVTSSLNDPQRSEVGFVWLQVGRTDEAIAWMAQHDAAAAGEIASATTRYEQALRCFDYRVSSDPLHWRQRADLAISETLGGTRELTLYPKDELRKMIGIVRVLNMVGRDGEAIRMGDRLLRRWFLAKEENRRISERFDFVSEMLLNSFARSDEHALDRLWRRTRSNFNDAVAKGWITLLDDFTWDDFVAVRQSVADAFPNADGLAHSVDTYDFLSGTLPRGWKAPEDLDRLVDEMMTPKRGRFGKRHPLDGDSSLRLVERFRDLGGIEAARQYHSAATSAGNREVWLSDLSKAVESGNSAVAGMALDNMIQSAVDAPLQWTASIDQLLEAIAKHAIAEASHGDDEAANQAEDLCRHLLHSPNASQRSQLARSLLPTTLLNEAAESLRRKMIVNFLDQQSPDLYGLAIAYHRVRREMHGRQPENDSEPLEPIDARRSHWYRLMTMRGNRLVVRYWPHVAFQNHLMRANEAIAARDRQTFEHALDRLLDVQPMEVGFVEETYKTLVDHGWQNLADQTVAQVQQHGASHLSRFAADAGTANNLSWLLAITESDLDQALAQSRKAVARHPESAVYRDTLAEILFRGGHAEQAARIESDCLLDDFGQWHLHQQLERFRSETPDEAGAQNSPGNPASVSDD